MERRQDDVAWCGHRESVWTIAALVICQGCEEPGAPTRDSSISMDTIPDIDAGGDASPVDVHDVTERGLIVDDAGWATPPWLPTTIRVQYAIDPGRMLPQLQWQPCTVGWLGCQEVVQDTAGAMPVPMLTNGMDGNTFDGGQVWLRVYTTIPPRRDGLEDWKVDMLAPLDGPVGIGWRRRTGLSGTDTDGSAMPFLAGRSFGTSVSYGDPRRSVMVRSDTTHPIAEARPFLDLIRRTELHGLIFQYMLASETALGFTDIGGVGFMPPPSPSPLRFFNEPSSAFARRGPALWGDAFFWEAAVTGSDGAIHSEQWVVRGQEAPHRLLSSGAADLRGFDTDGTRMAWVIGYDDDRVSGFERGEIWTAPYTTEPAALRPRRVHAYPAPDYTGFHQMAAGRYATLSPPGAAWVFNLDDNTYWRVDAPSGYGIVRVIFLSRDEVGLFLQPTGGGQLLTVRRRLDSLGPAQPTTR